MKLPSLKRDKRGVFGIVLFFIVLFSILIYGFVASISVAVIDVASDEVTPILEDIGVVEGTNISQAMENTVGVANGFVQSMPWLLAFGYGLALIFSIVFVASYKINPHPAFMAVYVALILLLIFGSIIISNAYEDIYTGSDDIALRLHENSAMSYMILYSPAILTMIAFIAGIYLFSSGKEEGGISV